MVNGHSIDTLLYNLYVMLYHLSGISGSDQDLSPGKLCYDRQVGYLSVVTTAYQVRNLDAMIFMGVTQGVLVHKIKMLPTKHSVKQRYIYSYLLMSLTWSTGKPNFTFVCL